MTWMRRIVIIAVVLGAGAPVTGCAPRGSSFETLGVPQLDDRPGRAALILGWAREDRSGWVITRVRVDDRTRNEWNEDTQAPTVFYLPPGEHELRLNAAQLADPRDRESRPRRRYRIRPLEIDLLEGEAQLCVLRLGGEERRRPRLQCEAYERVEDEVDDEYVEEDEYGDEGDAEGEEGVEDEGVERQPQAQAERPDFGATGMPDREADAAPEDAPADSSGIPSPFGPAAAAAPEPTPPEPAPAEQPAAAAPPRRLTLEQRIERLERMVEELRRELLGR